MLFVAAVLKVHQSPKIPGGHVPAGDPTQETVPVKLHSSPYVKVYRNVRQVPVIPTSIHPEALVGYVPAVSVLVGPQHAPQIPFVSPVVTPVHSNAAQVPSAFEHPNISAPKVPVVAQNVPKVTVIPENINTVFSQVDNIPQTVPQVSIVPEISYSNSPQVPIISHNTQVPLVGENIRQSIPQVSIISQNVPLIPIVPEFHFENSPKVPIVAQNSLGTVEPLNFGPNIPQEKLVSHNVPSMPVISPVSSPQVTFASTNDLQASPVPVKIYNPVDYNPKIDSAVMSVPINPQTDSAVLSVPINVRTDSTVMSVPINPQTDSTVLSLPINTQNGVTEVDIVSHNVPIKPVTVAKNINSQHSTKIFEDSSESLEKAFIPSQCQNTINKKSGASYPTVTFKHVLNPPENIKEYYNTASDEMNKIRLFRCHQEDEVGYDSSAERLAYHCHSDDVPVKLLVEVPKALQGGQIIDVELDIPYSVMVLHAANGNYDGVQKASFLQDLLQPCSYGVAVLRPEGFATRVIYLPVSVPDGKFIIHRIKEV